MENITFWGAWTIAVVCLVALFRTHLKLVKKTRDYHATLDVLHQANEIIADYERDEHEREMRGVQEDSGDHRGTV